MNLPCEDDAFDVAVMALVLFFVPEPAKGLAEMHRVVGDGGVVAAYSWDVLGGGSPVLALDEEMGAMGLRPPLPPSAEASRLDAMKGIWLEGGLIDVETREITVERSFADFEDAWETSRLIPSAGPIIASMEQKDVNTLKQRLEERLPAQSDGTVSCTARANAVKGRVGR